MPRIVETTVYELHELAEAARERARAWWRDRCLDNDWHEFVFEDFETVCGLLGVTLRTRPVPLMGSGTREKPQIFFRGFGSQGDGASFEGTYEYATGATRAVRSHAPQDPELHAIADALQDAQRRNFYGLSADIRQRGRHCHEHSMAIAVERDSPNGQAMTDDAEDAVAEAVRDLARWLHGQLEREHDHLRSDAAVDDAIAANDWAFTADGRVFA